MMVGQNVGNLFQVIFSQSDSNFQKFQINWKNLKKSEGIEAIKFKTERLESKHTHEFLKNCEIEVGFSIKTIKHKLYIFTNLTEKLSCASIIHFLLIMTSIFSKNDLANRSF